MVNKILTILLISISIALAADEDTAGDKLIEVEVPMSIEKIIKLDFVPHTIIKVANEQIVNYQVSQQKKEIMLVGQKPGDTTMTVRDTAGDIKARYLIKVTSSDQTKVVGQLKDLLKDIEGLEIGIKGDKVFIGGQIVVPGDIGRVNVVMSQFPEVLFFVELSPHSQTIIAKKMQDEVQKSGFKDVTVRVVNGQYWVEGVVGSAKEIERVEQIIKSLLPDKIENLARRTDAVQSLRKNLYEILLTENSKPKPEPIPKLFKIIAQFVELTKTYDKIFGFGWTPLINNGAGSFTIGKTSDGVTSSSNGSLVATISNLFPKLNSAKSAGQARVIQSGIIVVKEKVEGVINKTATLPYVLGAGETARTGTSTAGLKITIKPEMLQEERINLKMAISVSSTINSGNSAGPTTLDNSVNTEIVVKSQESAVVGGVVSNKQSTDYDKDSPNASDKVENGAPLFTFVKSKNYSTNRSQFVIFVTPEIIESAATGVSEIERKFRKRSR